MSIRIRAIELLATIFGLVFCTVAHADGGEVAWKNGKSTITAMSPTEISERLAALSVRPTQRRVVVRLSEAIGQDDKDALEAAGVTLLNSLGNDAWFATLAPSLDSERVSAMRTLVGVQPIETSQKLHPKLLEPDIPAWSILTPREGAGLDEALSYVAVYVLFHRDVSLKHAAALLADHGGGLLSTLETVNGVVAWLPDGQIQQLAADDTVMYVEPPLPPLKASNNLSRLRVGAETLQAPPYDLDGSGVSVLVYDSGRVFQHADFGSRLTVGPGDTSFVDYWHATHVAGTIGGDGTASIGTSYVYTGMAPGVDLVSYGFQQMGGTQLFQGFLFTDPGDLEQDYTDAIALGADLSNNSISTNVGPNGFPCDWEGDYGTVTAMIDSIARGSLGSPFLGIWATGNERGSSCGSMYNTTPPSACSKNAIHVGALDSVDSSVTDFTSWGPCDDGRLKPTLSAPGCQIGGDSGVTSTWIGTGFGYFSLCGTSQAAAAVTGVTALLLEQFRLSHPAQPDPLPSTIRAILTGTATDLISVGPDYQTGYGAVDGVAAIDLVQEGRFLEDEVAHGETYRFSIEVTAGDPELRVTLAWDDPPGIPNVSTALVNDLDLRVITPLGVTHFPWTLDPLNPGDAAVSTVKDSINNIEQVVIDAPVAGQYLVEIEGFNIAEGPSQTFGVATSPASMACDSAGSLLGGKSIVACESTLDVRVLDCDLNLNAAMADSASVSVTSSSEPGGESVLLLETGLNTGVFAGSAVLSQTDSAGVLQVADGDTVTATYTDVSDGQGASNILKIVQFQVDCSAPVATSVSTVDIGAGRATVRLTADSPVTATVRYGIACGAPDSTTTGLNHLAAQDVALTDLTPDTVYLFDLELVDDLGQTTIDDNGGACYTFGTHPVSMILAAELGAADPTDFSNVQLTFTPDGSPGGYSFCDTLAQDLPTDPSASPVTTQDTIYDLTGGETVSLYGQDYSRLYVSRNGYITFASADDDLSPSLIDHYRLPRVSTWFQRFNPDATLGLRVTQTAERVAATWVVADIGSNQNTFQAELFFDGRIRLTYLEMETWVGIVGLSDGLGLDPGFESNDFIEGACSPGPPQTIDSAFATVQGVPTQTVLQASDDGTPAPFRFSIDRLPLNGSLTDDTTGLEIVSVPHPLAAGISTVTYSPAPDWYGVEEFDFRAFDGGAPPTGGYSNTSAVTVTVSGVPQVLHEYLVDDSDPGWTTTGLWEFGAATGINANPPSGFTGANVYGYDLDGQYGTLLSPDPLTSTAIDVAGVTNLSVEFRRWVQLGDANDFATFLGSANNTDWTTLRQDVGPLSSTWTPIGFNLVLSPGSTQLWLRWEMGPTNFFGHSAGLSIDDVIVRGNLPFDCDPLDQNVTRAPSLVRSVRLDNSSTLTWEDQAASSGPSTAYELISGDVALGIGEPSPICLQNTSATSFSDARTPAPGQAYFYLVRGWNSCGGSTFGLSERDTAFPDTDADGPSDVCDP